MLGHWHEDHLEVGMELLEEELKTVAAVASLGRAKHQVEVVLVSPWCCRTWALVEQSFCLRIAAVKVVPAGSTCCLG